jgi:hypothetical protein
VFCIDINIIYFEYHKYRSADTTNGMCYCMSPGNGDSESLQNVGYDRQTDHDRRFQNVKVACFEFIMPVINVFLY